MGTGYSRNDTSNNIADGNIINASDLDGEFDAIQSAFNASTGHTHDGTTAEGAPIEVTGPAQEYVSTATEFRPKTNNTYDLGSAALQWKDLYVDGTANIDSLVADTADINAGTIDGVTIGGATPGAVTTSSLVATTADINAGTVDNAVIGGTTPAAGTFTTLTANGNVVLGDAATDTVTVNADVASDLIPSADGTYDLGAVGSEWQDLFVDGTANIDSLVADTADINGGTIDGTTIGGASAAAGTFTTATATTGNITTVNSTTVDTTNIEVTNIKAKDGTAAGSIADATGVVTLASSVLTTTDINGGTIDGVTIGGSSAGAITATTITGSSATISGDLTVDTNTLHVDSTNNRVGIGTTSPSEALDVVGNIRASGRIRAKVGSLSDVSFGSDGDHNNGIYFPASDTLGFVTSGAEAARIDSSGNMLIGQSTETEPGIGNTVAGAGIRKIGVGSFSRDGNVAISANRNNSDGQVIQVRRDGNLRGSLGAGTTTMRLGAEATFSLLFEIAGVEAARVDPNRNLLIGQSSTTFPGSSNTTTGHAIRDYGGVFHSASAQPSLNLNRNTSDGNIAVFRREGLGVGSISVTTTATTFNTSSDERLKENIADAGDAGAMIDALQIRQYDWKADGRHQKWGVVAQETDPIFPEAVTKGETEDDMWAVDYSKFVPALIKEIQDLRGRVAMLEAV